MAFEVFRDANRNLNAKRFEECKAMFSQLAKDNTLTAKIDMSSTNIPYYAKKLGYKIKTRRIDDNHCYVWIESTKTQEGDES